MFTEKSDTTRYISILHLSGLPRSPDLFEADRLRFSENLLSFKALSEPFLDISARNRVGSISNKI
jgi:hypothetical protein